MPEENLGMDDIFDNNTTSKPQSTSSSNNIKNAASKTVQNTGKTIDAAGKGMQAAGKGMEIAGKGAQAAGKGAEKAGQATQKAGKKASDTGKQIKNSGNKSNNKENKDSNKIKDATSKFGKINKNSGTKKDNDDKKEKKEEKNNNKDGDSNEGSDEGKKQSLKDKIKNKIKNSSIKADDAKEPEKFAKKLILKKIKKIVITIFLWLLLICIIIMSVWAFIEEALARLDQAANTVANTHEKLDNFLNGLGFQNSEDAFYEELNYLNRKYDYKLDIPLLMATLFYDDTHSDGDIGIEVTSDSDGVNPAVGLGLAWKWVKNKVKESNQTIGEDGLAYSSNKVYRLRKLAKQQFNTKLFGAITTTSTEETIGLLKYAKQCIAQIGDEIYQFFEALLAHLAKNFVPGATFTNTLEDLYNVIFEGEKISTTDTYNYFIGDGTLTHFLSIISTIFSSFADITGVESFLEAGIEGSSCGELICLTYRTYEYSDENYTNYLKKYYIKNMPEFKKYINASTDEIRDKEIDKIIQEIKDTSENYQDVFGKVKRKSSENYSKTCEGNIKESLLGDLRLPVDIPSGHSVTFTGQNKFGASGQVMHNGVNLNNTSAGVNQGDNVYSIYDMGEVLESTFDDTYEEKKKNSKLTGSWVKIKYSNISGDEVSDFTITYGGLSSNSLQLKRGDIVQKGDVIGKIGTKEESDGMEESSLYFAFYDNTAKSYLNPVNLFIPCSGGGSGINMLVHDIYSISESNFVTAINNYCSSHTCNQNLKSWNLNTVYRTAVDNNVNPKIVVLRAIDEGFAPHTRCNNYNYWGINVTNEGGGCGTSYSSLADGVKGYATLKIVQENETLGDLMTVYSYIGDYWYNTSESNTENTGLGGCYYYPYIKKFMTESRSNEVANACVSGKWCYKYGKGTCLKSIPDDQEAYKKYLCEKMENNDKAIFGEYSSSDSSGTYSGSSGTFSSSNISGLSKEDALKQLFDGKVPKTTADTWVASYMVTIDVPITKKDGTKTTQKLTVHKSVASDVKKALQTIQDSGFKVYSVGAYNLRSKNNNTNTNELSSHSYGIAIDINSDDNCYVINNSCYYGSRSYLTSNGNEYSISPNSAPVSAFNSIGWGWGGNWSGNKDTMHFSLLNE